MFSQRDFDALPLWAKGVIVTAFTVVLGTIFTAGMFSSSVSLVREWISRRV